MIKFWKFLPFLKDFFLSKEVRPRQKITGVALFVIYAVFPFDLIPDFLSVLGILDEFVIATFLLERLIKIAPDFLKEKYDFKEANNSPKNFKQYE